MKYTVIFILSLSSSCMCISQQQYSIRDLKQGRFNDDKPGFAGLKGFIRKLGGGIYDQ